MKVRKKKQTESGISSQTLCELVVKGMQEKKAIDIVVLDLKKVKNAIADYFVICSGNSDTQIDAIGDSIDEEVFKSIQQHPWHREGKMQKEWVLLDYVDVVAHVFKKERREFYKLEDLWGDAEFTHVSEAMEFSSMFIKLCLEGLKVYFQTK